MGKPRHRGQSGETVAGCNRQSKPAPGNWSRVFSLGRRHYGRITLSQYLPPGTGRFGNPPEKDESWNRKKEQSQKLHQLQK